MKGVKILRKIFCLLISAVLLLSGCSVSNDKKANSKAGHNSKISEKDKKKETKQTAENGEKEKSEQKSNAAAENEGQTQVGTSSGSNQSAQTAAISSNNPIVQAALKYRGSSMACDQLATMALVDTGVITGTPATIFHDGGYYNLGVYQFPAVATFISAASAQPGDLVYYDDGGFGSAHIAVYAGNGMAVHGGWNGSQVVLASVDISASPPKYMRFPSQSWEQIYQTLFSQGHQTGGNHSSNEPIPPNVETTYTTTMSLNDFTITITSKAPIDENFIWAQMEAYVFGSITYEQFVANVQAKGYTIS